MSADGAEERQAAEPATLPVEHFAAVQAALQDGFDLEDVLAVEGIDEGRWRSERAALTQSIAKDPDVYAAYQEALEEAQDRLRCSVDPLYEDVGAWIGLLLLVDTTSVADVCAKHRMTAGDFGRLERHWRARFDADADLAKEAKRLRKDAPPAPTTVIVGERRLVPSPYAHGEGADDGAGPEGEASNATRAAEPVEPEEVDRMAALEAYLAAGVDLGLLERRFGFVGREQAVARIERFRASLDRSAAIYYRQRIGHFEALAASGRSAPATSQKLEIATPSPDETSALVPSLLALPPLPFLDLETPALTPRTRAHSVPDDEPHPQQGQTGILDPGLFASLVTPFEGPMAASPAGDPFGETAALDVAALEKALAAMPFTGSASPPPSALDEIGPSASLDETSALDPRLLAEAVVPFAGLDAPAMRGHPLEGDLYRYASYCVELVEYEARAAEVRARYGVLSAEEHDIIAQVWTDRLGKDGEQRRAFQEAVKTYREWIRSHGSGSP